MEKEELKAGEVAAHLCGILEVSVWSVIHLDQEIQSAIDDTVYENVDGATRAGLRPHSISYIHDATKDYPWKKS